MSNNWIEIIKVVVDKGLLGLVLVVIGAYFGKQLEKYKARNAYAQILAQNRIDAYKEAFLVLASQHVKIHELLEEITSSQIRFPNQKDEAAAALVKRYDEVRQHMYSQAPTLLRSSLFLSEALAERIISHSNHLGMFFSAFTADHDPNELVKRLVELQQRLVETQRAMHSEVNRNLFE